MSIEKIVRIIKKINQFEIILVLIVVLLSFSILFVIGDWKNPIQAGDGPTYDTIAKNLLNHHSFSASNSPPIESTAYRTFGYPAFLALVYSIFGHYVLAVRLVQYFLFGGIVILLYRMTKLNFGEAAAKICAIFAVFYLPLIFFIPLYYTEILTSFLCLSVIYLIAVRDSFKKLNFLYIFIGILMGVLSLVRPSFGLLPVMIAAGLAFENRFYISKKNFQKTFINTLLIFSGFMLIMAPWLFRNYLVVGKPTISVAHSYESLYYSIRQYEGKTNYSLFNDWESQYFPKLKETILEASKRVGVQQGTTLAELRTSVPVELEMQEIYKENFKTEFNELKFSQVISSLPRRIFSLWEPNLVRFAPDWFFIRGVQRIPELQGWLLLIFSIVGFYSIRKTALQYWYLWFLPAYLTMIHLVFHVESRYSLPLHVYLMILGSVGVIKVFDLLKKNSGKVISD